MCTTHDGDGIVKVHVLIHVSQVRKGHHTKELPVPKSEDMSVKSLPLIYSLLEARTKLHVIVWADLLQVESPGHTLWT